MKDSKDDYFKSKEFRELLASYENDKHTGSPIFLHSDDLAEIADYYRLEGMIEQAHEAAVYGVQLHPGATTPLLFLSREALTQNNIPKAEKLAAEIEDKSDSDYHYLLAEIGVAKGKLNEAEEKFRKYYDETSDELERDDIAIDIGIIYLDYGYFEEAQRWLERCVNNDRTDYYEAMANVLFFTQNLSECAMMYEKLIDAHPYNPAYWLGLSNSQMMMGHYEESACSCNYGIAVAPECVDLYIVKAECLKQLQQTAELYKLMKQISSTESQSPQTLVGFASILSSNHQFQEALNCLEKAHGLLKKLPYDKNKPIYLSLYQEASLANFYLGSKPLASYYANEALHIAPNNAHSLTLKGLILLSDKLVDSAEECFRKAIAADNNPEDTMLRIFYAYYTNKLYEQAFQTLSSLHELYPYCNDGYTIAYLAICSWHTNRMEEFNQYLKEVTVQEPSNMEMVLHHIIYTIH